MQEKIYKKIFNLFIVLIIHILLNLQLLLMYFKEKKGNIFWFVNKIKIKWKLIRY